MADIDRCDVPEIGNLPDEYPEAGGMADEYPEMGAELGMLRQTLAPVKLALQQGAAGSGIGPSTSRNLADMVERHESAIHALQGRVGMALVHTKPGLGGWAGRSKAAQPIPLSPASVAGAPIALAAGATVPVVIVNTKGYPVDLGRLELEIMDPATGLPSEGVGVTAAQVNGDNWGDGNRVGAAKFAPNVLEPIPLNRRVGTASPAMAFNLVNSTALPLVATATVWCYPAPGITVNE
jgi:hypothetical protein